MAFWGKISQISPFSLFDFRVYCGVKDCSSSLLGVEVKPGKPYTHVYDNARGRLRISQVRFLPPQKISS